MGPSTTQRRLAILVSALFFPWPGFPMDTPLSAEAVREAYFLGQRRDQGMAELLERYAKSLPPPEAGPYVTSVTFYTPYALAVLDSAERSFNYHAQDAERDHRSQTETVSVFIQVQLTDSYGPYLMSPTGSRYASPVGISLRSSEFWKDFRVHVYSGEREQQKQVLPVDASGQPRYTCDGYGSCMLSGATIHFDFPAEAFTSDCAVVRVDPPEGDAVWVDFDLASLR